MSLMNYIDNGGPIMYVLLFLNILGLSTILWKFLALFSYKSKLSKWADQIMKKFNKRYEDTKVNDAVKVDLLKDDVVLFIKKLESGLNTIKIIASIAPLLGLLGTVIGILSAFDVISKTGLEDPSLFAGGISMALLTTVAGLIVAIPHFIGFNYLMKIIDNIESELEEVVIPRAFK